MVRAVFRTVVLCCVAFAGFCAAASANTYQFITPAGSTAGGQPVDATALFTTNTNSVSVTLTNNIVGQKSVAQNISDLLFTLNISTNGGSITTSSGTLRTVFADGSYADNGTGAPGWAFSDTNGQVYLNGLAGTYTPSHTIIGKPDASNNKYNEVNPSIDGNSPHNPFMANNVTWTLNIAGVTSSTAITGTTFSFGTSSGSNVTGRLVPVPEPAFLQLGGLLALAGMALPRLRRTVSAPRTV